MPRTARLEMPGSLYHIMAHSIEGKDLFVDDDDRIDFLNRLTKGIKKTGFQCFAWSLMDNHYHLLIRSNHLLLSELMQGLNSGYARSYNKKYKRRGYLFQDRFKSVLCQDKRYASELIRYIHLNPLRAGKVKSLEELKNWAWSGHGYLSGKLNANGALFQNREECLRCFGITEPEAICNYFMYLSEKSFLDIPQKAGLLYNTETIEIKGSCKGWPAVIGNPEFVQQAMEQHKVSMFRKHRKADYPYVLKKISQKVCTSFGISLRELMKRGRQNIRSNARAAFCYDLHVNELLPHTVIADYLRITLSPVAKLIEQGQLNAVKPSNVIAT